jgi:hypothetical protein
MWVKVYRRKIVHCIVLYNIYITIITPGEDGYRFEMQPNSLGDLPCSPNASNSTEICTFSSLYFVLFWGQQYTVQVIPGYCSRTSGSLRSTSEVVSEDLMAYRFTLSQSGSIRKHLEEAVRVFRVAELFGWAFLTMQQIASVDTGWPAYSKSLAAYVSEGKICWHE